MIREGGGRHQRPGYSWALYLTLAVLMLVWIGAASAQVVLPLPGALTCTGCTAGTLPVATGVGALGDSTIVQTGVGRIKIGTFINLGPVLDIGDSGIFLTGQQNAGSAIPIELRAGSASAPGSFSGNFVAAAGHTNQSGFAPGILSLYAGFNTADNTLGAFDIGANNSPSGPFTTSEGIVGYNITGQGANTLSIGMSATPEVKIEVGAVTLSDPTIVTFGQLKTTGAATGKTVVCVDTTTGQLYASTSDVQCLN